MITRHEITALEQALRYLNEHKDSATHYGYYYTEQGWAGHKLKALLDKLPEVVKKLTEINRSQKCLNALQDSVWKSLGAYSNKLGWGLTGIQPECWTLLDAAVDELAKRRAADEQIVRIIERLDCRCLTLDCRKHGSYNPDDSYLLDEILKSRKNLDTRRSS